MRLSTAQRAQPCAPSWVTCLLGCLTQRPLCLMFEHELHKDVHTSTASAVYAPLRPMTLYCMTVALSLSFSARLGKPTSAVGLVYPFCPRMLGVGSTCGPRLWPKIAARFPSAYCTCRFLCDGSWTRKWAPKKVIKNAISHGQMHIKTKTCNHRNQMHNIIDSSPYSIKEHIMNTNKQIGHNISPNQDWRAMRQSYLKHLLTSGKTSCTPIQGRQA